MIEIPVLLLTLIGNIIPLDINENKEEYIDRYNKNKTIKRILKHPEITPKRTSNTKCHCIPKNHYKYIRKSERYYVLIDELYLWFRENKI